jgi:hypothetical protein
MREPARYFLIRGLEPADALDLLARTPDVADLADVRVRIDDTRAAGIVDLIVPCPPGAEAPDSAQRPDLVRTYEQRRGQGDFLPALDAPIEQTLPIYEAAATLVRRPASAGVTRAPGELLLVAQGITPEHAASIVDDLQLYSTGLRIAPGVLQYEDDESIFVFHINDDTSRGGAVLASGVGEAIPDCVVLDCFRAASGDAVFLPRQHGLRIRPDVLTACCRLAERAPGLFRSDRVHRPAAEGAQLDGDRRLLAVYPWPPGQHDQCRVVYLGDVVFLDRVDLLPPALHVTYRLAELDQREEAFSQLADDVARAMPRSGYRPELRPSTYVDTAAEEVSRLREQILDLQFREAAAQSIVRSKPQLYRFTARQLPALAEQLASYPMAKIQEGGFQCAVEAWHSSDPGTAAEQERAPAFYVYVDPDRAGPLTEVPRLLWERRGDPPMRFWLDPYWSAHYQQDANQSLVFVPYGTALFPPLHDWRTDQMDEHLCRLMRRWFQESRAAPELPARAMYLFDGQPRPDAEMHITVLDRDGFRPLEPQIGWLNSQLDILQPDRDALILFEQAASANRRHAEVTRVTERAAEKLASFEALSLTVEAEVRGRIAGLHGVFRDEIQHTAERYVELVEELVTLKMRLEYLADQELDVKALEKKVERVRGRAIPEVELLKTEYEEAIVAIDTAIADADRERVNAQGRLQEQVERLLRTRDALQAQLASLV